MIRKLTEQLRLKQDEKKVFWVVLVTAAFVAGGISLWIGLRQSVWFDEAYSILLAKQPIGELLRLTALDTHPPFYYLLLKGWAGLFGWSELSLRMLSVGSLMAAVIFAGLLLRRMFTPRIAMGGVLLLMLAPLVLRYGFEIRMYAVAMLLGITATYALYSAWQSTSKQRLWWLVSYGVLVVLGVYTLYYLAFLWIAHVVWLLFMRKHRGLTWKELLPYVGAYIGALIVFLPWLPTTLGQFSNGALAPIGQPLNLEQLIGIGTFNILYQPLYAVAVPLTIVAIAVIGVIAWAIPRALVALRGKSAEVMLLVLYGLVPIVLLMIISLSRSMYTERYLSHVAIGMILLLALIVLNAVQHPGIRNKRRSVLLIGILYGAFMIGTMQLASVGNFNFQRMQTPTVRQAAASIVSCAAGTKLLAADPYVATELRFYLPECEIYFVSQWDTLGGGYAFFSGSPYQIKDVAALQDAKITYVHYGTPDQLLPETYQQVDQQAFGALIIAHYQRAK